MKNLKKVLALVVALTMVLGTVGFAAYTDVAEDAGEYTAVSTLSSLSILTGYEDGSFKPDGDITRAEFATVVCRALGAKVSGSAVTGFTDVPADHWASAYIAYCAGAGIVNGMGDGTFAPSANVTVEQAVKMLVVALGYEPMAAAKGGYPTGYMVVANTNGITEGVGAQTAAATRADVAKLVYNALDVPMMVQDGFGTQVSFKVADGREGNPSYQSLLTGLDVAKLDGKVVATPVIGDTTDNGFVSFTVADHYDSEDFEDNDGDMVAGPYDFKVAEGVNAADYFGIASTVFVKEYAKGKYEIIAIMPNANNTTVELGIEDIEAVTAAGISYYTSESKYDSELLKFEANSAAVDFYYNNNKEAAGDYTSITDYIDQNEDVEIVAHDTNDNNRFDTVIVKKYEYARVQYVEADRDNFTAGGETFKFDFDNDTPVTMVDKNGDAITLAEFEKDDVIAYIVEGFAADKWKEIINLGKNTVTGTVGEVKADAVYIDGTEYGFKGAQPSLGDEGTFYLTRTGKIFNFEVSASITGNYAYILGVAHTDANGFSKEWQVKMLTKDNEIVTYAVKDGADIFGVTINKDTTYNSAGTLNDLRVATSDAVAINDPAYVTRRIVTYELNSKGLITEINAVATTEFGDADSNSAASQAEYEKDAQYLGTDLEDDTVIFNITSDNENSVFATTLDTLVDENKYGGYYVTHVVNGTTEADCLVVTYGGSKLDVEQDLAIITNVTTTTIGDNEKAKKVTYVTANDDTAKVITIAEDDDVSVPEWGTSYEDDINVGAAMMFTDDGNGTAAAYGVVIFMDVASDGSAIAGAVGRINSAAQSVIEGADKNLTIIDGYIESYDSGNNGMVIKAVKSDGTPLANVVIKAETNRYTFVNESANRQRVHAADWKAGNVAKADEDNDTANYFIAIKSRSTVKDIIVYSEQQSVGYDVQH